MVQLQKTGWILLVGDAVHLQGNWDTSVFLISDHASGAEASDSFHAAIGPPEEVLSHSTLDQSREIPERQIEQCADLLRVSILRSANKRCAPSWVGAVTASLFALALSGPLLLSRGSNGRGTKASSQKGNQVLQCQLDIAGIAPAAR